MAHDLLLSTSIAVTRLCSADPSRPIEPRGVTHATFVARGQGLYYGLAADHYGSIWAAARCSKVSDGLPTEAEEGQLLRLSGCLSATQATARRLDPLPPRALRDLHGIAMHRGALWSACSYDDAVCIYSLSH